MNGVIELKMDKVFDGKEGIFEYKSIPKRFMFLNPSARHGLLPVRLVGMVHKISKIFGSKVVGMKGKSKLRELIIWAHWQMVK